MIYMALPSSLHQPKFMASQYQRFVAAKFQHKRWHLIVLLTLAKELALEDRLLALAVSATRIRIYICTRQMKVTSSSSQRNMDRSPLTPPPAKSNASFT